MDKDNYVKVSGPIMFNPAKNLKRIGANGTAKNLFAIDIGTNGKKSAFNITAWEDLAEAVANTPEGTFITVIGELFSRSWQNKTTGAWEREQGVVAREIHGLTAESDNETPWDPSTEEDIPF